MRQELQFLRILAIMGFLALMVSCQNEKKETPKKTWVGTWVTAPQLVEPHNMPPEPGLTGNTLRQRLRVSLGGDSIRIRFSNAFSTSPVTLKAVEIAKATDSSSVDISSSKHVTFNNQESITLEPGKAVVSDALSFAINPREDLAITIYFGQTSPDVTGHPGSRTTSYLLSREHVSDPHFQNAIKTDHWYVINGIEVLTDETSAAVVVIGNSITDGRGSGTNKQNRWPDVLSERLLADTTTRHIAVLNQGIGGNCVTKQCLGPSALDRFQRDVLDQKGLKWLIVLEGVNDIGTTPDSIASMQVAKDLIAGYQQMIDQAHSKGVKVFGGTIMPFGESFYYTDFHEEARQSVNTWIRSSGQFDAVIDFDKALQSAEDSIVFKDGLHTGDFLHPNEAGHKAMGEVVDLGLFK